MRGYHHEYVQLHAVVYERHEAEPWVWQPPLLHPGRPRRVDRAEQVLDLSQSGTCPEGSACACPRLWLDGGKPNARKIRAEAAVGSFIPSGTASVAVTLEQFAENAASTILQTVLTGMLTASPVGWAVAAQEALGSPSEWIGLGLTIAGEVMDGLKWTCTMTAGCWLKEPK